MVLEETSGNQSTNCPSQDHQNLTLSLRGVGLYFQCNTTLYQELPLNWNGHCGLDLLTPNSQKQKKYLHMKPPILIHLFIREIHEAPKSSHYTQCWIPSFVRALILHIGTCKLEKAVLYISKT